MNFDLPIISSSANPEFRDASACAAWLQTLPLINVGPSHGRLLGELEEINCCEIAPGERLRILELLREPILFIQTEQAKKFSNRSVPLAKQEREILLNVIALWKAYGNGYLHGLQALAGASTGLLAASAQLALACQRALWCASQEVIESHRCYLEVATNTWKTLHQLYALAEERKFVDQQVEHPLQGNQWKTTCMETYVQPLLLHAANPSEQSARQQGITARWLDRWGNNARIKRSAPVANGGARHPLIIDLSGTGGPGRNNVDPAANQPGNALRYLDVDELSKSMRSRIALLKKGDAPSSLSLGDDVPAQLAEHLLGQLHRQWCEDNPVRSPARMRSSGSAQLTTGMGAIHYFITGLPFRQPADATELTKAQREEIATFGRISTHADDDYAVKHGFTLEKWDVRDESLAGLRLERETGQARFAHTQLVAVRPADARHYLLGAIRWLIMDQNYRLRIGIRTLPGIPRGVSIRAPGLNAMTDKYVPAMQLSEVPALRAPASLILPVGWFRPKRIIEVYADKSSQMRLSTVIERGTDFERIAYEVV